jgi:hypothetical protein
MALPPLAISSALAGNVLWMVLLAVVGSQTVTRRACASWTAGVRLAALQAATVPTALGAYMVLSIVTRTDTQPGVPRFDVWNVWTYLTRHALGAPFVGERVPLWLAPVTVAIMAGAPMAVGMLGAKRGRVRGRHDLTADPAARCRCATAVTVPEVP